VAQGKRVYVAAPKKNDVSQEDRAQWSEKKKNEALAYFVACGSLAETSRQCVVPYDTVKYWSRSDWWKDRINDIRSEDYDRLDSKLTKALDKALDQVMDRIENGDEVFDSRTGGTIRVGAKLRDLNAAFNGLMDKRQLIRKQPTKIVEQQSTAHQLQNLANQFAAFVSGKPVKETIDQVAYMEGDLVEEGEDGIYHVVDNTVEIEDGNQNLQEMQSGKTTI
jgi:hypothetical protein